MHSDSIAAQLARPLVPMTDDDRRTAASIIEHYRAMPVMAWWRVPEILLVRRIPMAAPILDLGCGDRRMAEVIFGGSGRVLVGIDLSAKEARRARDRGIHRLVVRANLQHRLPLADGQFATVVSNSVFEHVAGIESVFAEIHRVLRPGGRLVFTVPSEHLNAMLRWPRRLERGFGARVTARWCHWWDGKLAHVNLGGEPYWTRLLEGAGFRLAACRHMLGPELVAEFERWQMLHNVGVGRANLGNLLRGAVAGLDRVGWRAPLRHLRARTTRRVEDLLGAETTSRGANLLFVADRAA